MPYVLRWSFLLFLVWSRFKVPFYLLILLFDSNHVIGFVCWWSTDVKGCRDLSSESVKGQGCFFFCVCVRLILVINSLTSHYFNWLCPVGFSDTTSLASIILILLTALHHMVCKDVIEHCLLMIYLIILFLFCAIWLTTA